MMIPPDKNRRLSFGELAKYAEAHPLKFKELQVRAAKEVEAKQKMRDALAKQQQDQDVTREALIHRRTRALTITGVPRVDLSDVRGIIAYRGWTLTYRPHTGEVILHSTAHSTITWKPIMFADKVPTEYNTNGIYCYKLTPEWLISSRIQLQGTATGLVEVRGDIIEHTDGVLRAEWVRLLCILLDYSSPIEYDMYNVVRGLYLAYPFVPIHVVNSNQISELLFWIAFFQRQHEV